MSDPSPTTTLPAWQPDPRLVADLRTLLADLQPEDAEQRFEAAAWSALLDSVGPDLLTRRPTLAHLTASALVLSPDGDQTCLVLHGRMGKWVQPGGHLEETDLTVASAAVREVREETGLEGFLLPAVRLSRHLAPCRPEVDYHLDVRFILITEPTAPMLSEESRDVRWWPSDRLPDPMAPQWDEDWEWALRTHRRWRAGG